MFRLLSIVLSLVALVALCPVASAAPYCQAGQSPRFVFGFAALAQAGAPMGTSMECEHANAANGDTLQQTSNGLSFYRKATNTPTFTDGFNHWALTPSGMVTWTGSSIDPPPVIYTPTATVCTPAEINGPATVCFFTDGRVEAFRHTASADVVLASKSPGGSWVLLNRAGGASCGRVDDPPPTRDQGLLMIECIGLDFEYKLQPAR